MGGKDVVHIKQMRNSELDHTEVQKLLKQLADERFSVDSNQISKVNPAEISGKLKVPYRLLLKRVYNNTNHF